jgi:hypothetical protein
MAGGREEILVAVPPPVHSLMVEINNGGQQAFSFQNIGGLGAILLKHHST